MADAGELLARQAASLVERLRLWTPQRWAAAAGSRPGTRADLVHHLAQSFVTRAGETDRPLPRLDSDLALPDQLAVTADDLARTGRATVEDVAHLLAHRRDLLGEDVPASLLEQLAGAPVQCPDRPEGPHP
jgi:hypothetical protein